MINTDFQERLYREDQTPEGLVSFRVTVKQTDLWIAAQRDLSLDAISSINRHRAELEDYIEKYPDFASSLQPWRELTDPGSLPWKMVKAANSIGIGPMAAVAGAISEEVARDLAGKSQSVLVENGGDLYLSGRVERTVGLWAGNSAISGKAGLKLNAKDGLAVCTSSGTVGPSLSLGNADAATVVSSSGALADAAATELGNRVKSADDVEKALNWVTSIEGIDGAVVIIGDSIGVKGEVELVSI